jgi:ATP-binding cassette subfamily B protein
MKQTHDKKRGALLPVVLFYLPYMKKRWVLIMLSFIAWVIVAVLELYAPTFIAQFIDGVAASQGNISPQQFEQLLHLLFIFGGILLAAWVIRRAGEFGEIGISPAIMKEASKDVFEHTIGHSYRFFTNNFAGALVRKINRLIEAYDGIFEIVMYNFTFLAVSIVGIFYILANRSMPLAITILVWIVVYVVAFIYLSLKVQHIYERQAEKDSDVSGQYADVFSNNLAVRFFASRARETDRVEQDLEHYRRLQVRAWSVNALVNAAQGFLSITARVGIFMFALLLLYRGSISLGVFVLVQTYVSMLIDQVWTIGRMVRRFFSFAANAKEGVELYAMPHEVADPLVPEQFVVTDGEIQFEDVTFNYNETRSVLEHFNVTVHGGEKVALVGPSGAGKSTVMGLVLRLHDVTGGKVMIDGTNVSRVRQDDLHSKIAVVPQEPLLFHRSLMENIRYGKPDASDEEVYEAARKAHCDEFIRALPQRYETLVGERGVKLSGGERQRVAIARALIKDAPILLLDEATSSLDSESERYIQDALGILMQGKTVVVIAHRLSTIARMDRIIVMEEGNIVEEGSHTQLLEQNGLYKKLWDMQAGGFLGD